MYTEYLIVDDHTEGQKIEHVGKVVPYVGIAVLSGTLGIESVGLCHTSRLVIAAYQMHSVWVSKFQTDKERNGFDTEHSAIDVVACGLSDIGPEVRYSNQRGWHSLT